MLVRIKEDKECADCGKLVTLQDQNSNKNSLHKTQDGALVCKDCFLDSEEEAERG